MASLFIWAPRSVLILTVFSPVIYLAYCLSKMPLIQNFEDYVRFNPGDGFRQTSSGGGYRPSRSLWRPCRRASVLRRSMSSGAVCSNTDGRRASGEEFFRSKILEAQLPRGVSSRLTDRRFASSCSTRARQRDEIMHFSFFQASMSPLSAHCRCFR